MVPHQRFDEGDREILRPVRRCHQAALGVALGDLELRIPCSGPSLEIRASLASHAGHPFKRLDDTAALEEGLDKGRELFPVDRGKNVIESRDCLQFLRAFVDRPLDRCHGVARVTFEAGFHMLLCQLAHQREEHEREADSDGEQKEKSPFRLPERSLHTASAETQWIGSRAADVIPWYASLPNTRGPRCLATTMERPMRNASPSLCQQPRGFRARPPGLSGSWLGALWLCRQKGAKSEVNLRTTRWPRSTR